MPVDLIVRPYQLITRFWKYIHSGIFVVKFYSYIVVPYKLCVGTDLLFLFVCQFFHEPGYRFSQ